MPGISRQRYEELQAAARAEVQARGLAPSHITLAVVAAFASANAITRPTARRHLVQAAHQMQGNDGPPLAWGGSRSRPAPAIARHAYALQLATAKRKALDTLDESALAIACAATRAALKDLEQETQRRQKGEGD